jgi:hypothetical protein
MLHEEEIQIYKGKYFSPKLCGNKKTTNAIALDLDETLGSFSDLETLWSSIKSYNDSIPIDFNKLLDLYPEFLRYGILPIMDFIYQKKRKGACDKIYMYTNNQCSPPWCKLLAKYFDYKLRTDSDLFDKIICAFKINNKIVEIGRTTHNKTYSDFIKCTLLPLKTKLCFIDNTYFNEMVDDRVYYIQPRSYIHNLSSDVIINRFLTSELCSKNMSNAHRFLLADHLYVDFSKRGFFHNSNMFGKNLEIDIHVAQKIMYHIKEFFYLIQKKSRTKKIKYPIGRFTRRKAR